MARFKEALERGKKARRELTRNKQNEANATIEDFGAQARRWLNDVVVTSLEAAKAELAGEITIDIDPAPCRQVGAVTPSVRFQIRGKPGSKQATIKPFTVSVQVSGEVSVSSPGIVAEDVGNIGDRSDERFRNLVAKLVEDFAKGTSSD